jgi:hypothetical protein
MPNIPGPLIINPIPFRLGGEADSSTSSYVRKDLNYDFAIGGIPFLAGISNRSTYFRRRYTRDMSPISKDQFDNGQQVGEQSFTGWWLRSQQSFHGGSGILYSDSGQDPSLSIRYQDSYGIDPWTVNQITLQKAPVQALVSANTNFAIRGVGIPSGPNTGDWTLCADGTSLKLLSATTTAFTYTITGMTGAIMSLTDDGTNYYVGTASGIYSGPINNATGGTLYATTNGGRITLGWQADRLCVAQGLAIYLGVLSGDNLTTKTPTYSAQAVQLVWSSFAGGPTAIYASSVNNHVSQIFKFTLDNTGSVPIIDAGTVVAELPHGEVINDIYGYLQAYIGITTNKGFRIGIISTDGSIAYGQLLWSTDPNISGPVQGIVGRDRFFYVGTNNTINGSSGLIRVDLGTTTTGSAANTNFAYAKDLSAHVTGQVVAAATHGTTGQVVVAVAGSGVFVQSATILETTGAYTTSRIRYNTLEPKLFKYLSLRAPTGFPGTVQIFLTDPTGATNMVTTISNTSSSLDNIGLGYPLKAQEWISLQFVFTRGTTTTGPTINGWQVKGYPGTVRQRLLTVPLLLFDHEKDKFGQRTGQTGSVWGIIQQFENLATQGNVTLFQDLNTGENQLVIIDDYEFEQLAEPQQNGSSKGGFLTLQLRTIP